MAHIEIWVRGYEKYSDLTLKCWVNAFKVHRALVCIPSPVFAAAIDGNFKEAATNEIDISDDELDVVLAMIRYLYTGDYNDNGENDDKFTPEPVKQESREAGEENGEVVDENGDMVDKIGKPTQPEETGEEAKDAERFIFNTKMYIIGDKYDIPTLKDLAKRKYSAFAESKITPFGVYTPPGALGQSFIGAAKLLCDHTMESDRDLAQVVARTAIKSLPSLLEKEEFLDLLGRNGRLCLDILLLAFGRELSLPEPAKEKRKGKKGKKDYSRG